MCVRLGLDVSVPVPLVSMSAEQMMSVSAAEEVMAEEAEVVERRDERERTERHPGKEADNVHRHRSSLLPRSRTALLLNHTDSRHETLDERPVLHDRAEENEALARLVVLGDGQQGPAQLDVLPEPLGGLAEPGVHLGIHRAPG